MTNKWISVKELDKLLTNKDPNFEWASETVLITDEENVSVGFFEPEYFAKNDEDPLTYSSSVWHDYGDYLRKNISGYAEVTHWMPLPKPPNYEG